MAIKDELEAWDVQFVNRIAHEVKRLRGTRSAREIAEHTAELGYPISQQVITRLENGRRPGHLEVAELVVLAQALGVPPVQLLYPDLPDDEVEYVPGITTDSWTAIKWFSGEAPAPGVDNEAIDLMRRHDTTMQRLTNAYDGLRATLSRRSPNYLEDPNSPESTAQQQAEAVAQFQIRSTIDSLKRLRQTIRDAGLNPPTSSNFADEEQQLDIFTALAQLDQEDQ